MNQMTKSLILVGLAAGIAVAAVVLQPRPPKPVGGKTGDPLFPAFTGIAAVRKLEMIFYDPAQSKSTTLSLVKEGGKWVFGSEKQKGYPADVEDESSKPVAEQRILDAALQFVDLSILDIATTFNSEHEYYRVVEPKPDDPDQTDTGLGLLVRVRDASDTVLAHLIIGGAQRGDAQRRFVRIPGQDHVFTVKIDPERFATEFSQWVKGNLAEITSSDVAQIVMSDYVSPRPGLLIPRNKVTVKWNQGDFKWELGEFIEFRGGRPVPTELYEDEELNSSKLTAVKNALGDLKFVGVERLPEEIALDLANTRALLENDAALSQLQQRGFYAQTTRIAPDKIAVQLLSSNGAMVVTSNDGVEYGLRFGGPASVTRVDGETKLNRFVLVSARVNSELLPEPEYEPVPESPAKEPADAGADPSSDETSDAEEDPDDPLAKERERIEKDNEQKRREWQQKVTKAEDKAADLNERFGKWFFVVSEDVYKKVQLGRFDIVKVKDDAEGYSITDFRELQAAGLAKGDEADDHGHAGHMHP